MSDDERKQDAPEGPASRSPGPAPEERQEEQIARLLRLAGPRPAVEPERVERVRAAVHARWRSEIRRRRSRTVLRWMALPAAAAAVVVAMIGLVRWLPQRAPEVGTKPLAVLERAQAPSRRGDGGSVTPGAELPSGLELSAGTGGRMALKLLTGVSVRLDSDTTLRLVSGTVLDLVQGAVYVDSRGANGAGLAVRTPAGTVRDVGTQFEVRLHDESLRVTVREGVASLGRNDGNLEIPAGSRLTAGPGGEISRSTVAPHGPDWDWILEIAPPFPLEGQTLGSFLVWVSRETGREIRFADPAAERAHLSIVLHGSLAGLRPDEAPSAILPTCGLKSRLEGEVLLIEPLDASRGFP